MALTELHYKEYDKLQTEISQLLAEISSLEKFSVLSSGGVFSWLLTDGQSPSTKLGFFLPAILVGLFGLIAWGQFKRIKLIGAYIREKYEPLLNEGQDEKYSFGWERYLDKALGKNPSWLFSGRAGMWLIHFVTDLIIAIVLYCGSI
jgi:hypothetical protein